MRQTIHEDEPVREPGERVTEGALGFPFKLRGAGQSRSKEIGHQLEYVDVRIVEMLRLAGHDSQTPTIPRPGPWARLRWHGLLPGGTHRRPLWGLSPIPAQKGHSDRTQRPERLPFPAVREPSGSVRKPLTARWTMAFPSATSTAAPSAFVTVCTRSRTRPMARSVAAAGTALTKR